MHFSPTRAVLRIFASAVISVSGACSVSVLGLAPGPLFAAPPATPGSIPPAAAASVVRVGDKALQVPAPPGFQALPASMRPLRQALEQTVPPAHRLLAVFVPEADLQRMKDGQPVTLTRSATLLALRSWENKSPQPADLARLREEARRALGASRVNEVASATNEHLARVLRPPQAGPADGTPRLERLKFQGLFDEGDTSFSMLMLTDYSGTGPGRADDAHQMAVASTFALVRGELVMLHVYSSLRAPSDMEWVRSQSRRWHAALVRDNL
jgi:hypothetical protein